MPRREELRCIWEYSFRRKKFIRKKTSGADWIELAKTESSGRSLLTLMIFQENV
jgi:hypothetical protein